MKNDYQLLDLHTLAQEFRQQCKEQIQEETLLAKKVQLAAYNRRVQALADRLQQYDPELGSDGLIEAAQEQLGPPPEEVVIDSQKIVRQVRDKLVSDWIQRNQIPQKLSHFPYQWMSYFATWRPIKVGELYCPEATFNHNVVEPQDMFALGSVLLARVKRSEFFKNAPKGSQQYKSPINPLVPVVLAAFKRYHNIPYMQWDLKTINKLENDDIAELVGCKVPQLSEAEILALRNTALTPKSGPRTGKTDNPATSANLYHLTGTAIAHLPKLAKYIVLQTWAAHPQHRDPYAICDLENWDHKPEPLATCDVFVQDIPTKQIAPKKYADLPWLA